MFLSWSGSWSRTARHCGCVYLVTAAASMTAFPAAERTRARTMRAVTRREVADLENGRCLPGRVSRHGRLRLADQGHGTGTRDLVGAGLLMLEISSRLYSCRGR